MFFSAVTLAFNCALSLENPASVFLAALLEEHFIVALEFLVHNRSARVRHCAALPRNLGGILLDCVRGQDALARRLAGRGASFFLLIH